jgi:hypothetical protein
MENKTIAAVAACVGLFVLASEKEDEPSYPSPPIVEVTLPSEPLDLEVVGGPQGILGIDDQEINENSQPDYDNWIRKDWALYFRAIYALVDPNDAMNFVWEKWLDHTNPLLLEMFPVRNALILSLVGPSSSAPVIGDNAPFIITADSTPIYETTSNLWNGIYSWDCEHWKMWYNKMKDAYGVSTAVDRFVNAWNYADNWGWTINLTAGQWCGIDCDFINYFRTQGIDVAVTGSSNFCTLVDVTTDLIDATKHTSEGIKKTASLASTWLPIAIVGGVVYVIGRNVQKVS